MHGDFIFYLNPMVDTYWLFHAFNQDFQMSHKNRNEILLAYYACLNKDELNQATEIIWSWTLAIAG